MTEREIERERERERGGERERERSIACLRVPGCTTRRLLARSRFNHDAIPARPLYSPQGNHLGGSHSTAYYIVNGLPRENTRGIILEYRTSH